MSEAIDLASADLWLKQAVGHEVTGPLSKADALVLTAKIKGYAGVTWVLIASAHEHKAHKALGYKTWEAYVAAEFDMSRSRSYQLISQAKVVLEISESVSTMVDISERQARDLAPVVEQAKAAAIEAVEALPEGATDADKAAAVSTAVDGVRSDLSPTGDAPSEEEGTPAATGSGDGEDVAPGQTREASSPSSSAPGLASLAEKVDQSEAGYRATSSRYRAATRTGLMTLDPERVALVTPSEDRAAVSAFAHDLIAWCSDLLGALSDSTQLRRVK